VRPLALGLLDGEKTQKAQKRRVKAVENRRYRIGTGFLSTPFILGVLSESGHTETAYRMLENEESPSWLAEVNAGATTIWEDWDGTVSLNHYANGAVCEWLFNTVGGIHVEGENRFIIAPFFGGSFTFAETEYKSVYGKVKSRWEKSGGRYNLTVDIPPNTSAEIILPNGEHHTKTAGKHEFISAEARHV
jgi:alpha-L-rhamnosidase